MWQGISHLAGALLCVGMALWTSRGGSVDDWIAQVYVFVIFVGLGLGNALWCLCLLIAKAGEADRTTFLWYFRLVGVVVLAVTLTTTCAAAGQFAEGG